MANRKQCAHEPCECETQGTLEFCSDECESSAAAESKQCLCGHEGCAASDKTAQQRRRMLR